MLERMNDGEVKRIIAKDMVIKKLSAVQIAALGDISIQKKNDPCTTGDTGQERKASSLFVSFVET